MVCKLVITDGVAGAFNNDGSPSSLYQEALDYYGNQESAISVWNTSNSDEYLNAVGKTSEESTLEDVLGFASNFDISTTKLSEQELKECIQFMIQNNIESLEDLTTKMMSLFKEKGYFEVSTRKLVKSGLYTQQEAESIDSSKILNFLNKLESTSLNLEVTQAPELNPSKFDIRLKSGEKTVFGTFKKLAITDVVDFVVKNTNSKEYNDILAVLSNSELFSNVVNVMEESTSAREYIMSEITSKTSIPRAFIGLDGSITDVDISEEINLKNLLLSNINPIELLADVEFLNSISNLVWNTRNGQIKNVLKGIEKSLIKFNVDVIGVSEIAQDNKETVMVLLESAYNMLENPTPENISQFASVKREIFGNDNSRAVINEDSKLNGLTTYHIETELTPGQMFDDYGMLKIGDNIYHKVSVNTQEAYSQLYNMLIDGSLIIPQNLFTTDSPMAPENFESTMVSLSNFINSRETGVESINNEQVSIAQVLFGYGNLNVENILPNSTLENEDYLRTEFVSDFYEYVLEEKIKGSDVYDKVLKHFNVSDTDLNLNTAITPNISGIKYEKELRDYASIKREGQIKELQTSVVEDVELDTLYMNKPNLVREVGGNFVQNGEYLVKAPSYDLYTRVGDTLYRKVVTTEDKDVYREVNTNRDGTYFQTNFNFETSSAEAQKIAKDTILYKQVTPTAKAVADNIKQSTVTKKSELKSILDQLMKTNLAKGYEIMSSEEIRNKLIELGVDADVAFQIIGENGAINLDAFDNGTRVQNLEVAKQMQQEGADSVKIWKDTGWFQDSDGKWKTEILDGYHKSVYVNLKPSQRFEGTEVDVKKLKDIYENELLFKAYKGLEDLEVVLYDDGVNGSPLGYSALDNRIIINIHYYEKQNGRINFLGRDDFRAGILHEIQHYIQSVEGFTRGGSPRTTREQIKTAIAYANNTNGADSAQYSGIEEFTKVLKDFIHSNYPFQKEYELTNLGEDSLLVNRIAMDMYSSLGGEVEARNVQTRFNNDLRNVFILGTQDRSNANKIDVYFQQNGITLLPNGFYHNGKVYINQDTATIDTPTHEFSHAYNQLLKNERPEFYKEGLNLIEKEGKQYIDFVKKNQPNLQGEALLEEALAQAVGDAGAKLIEAEKSTGLKQWLQNAWNKIKEMLGLSSYTIEQVRNMSLQEYTNAVATDLLRGEEVNFKTPSEEYFERNADRLPLTLAVFNRPEFKAMQGKMVNPTTVLNSLNQSGIKQIEKDLIKQIIQDNYQGQKKISYDELEATVRANIMPHIISKPNFINMLEDLKIMEKIC